MIYTSTENKKIKEIKKLNVKKYRDIKNKFLVEGEHLVLEAYKNNLLELLIVEEKFNINININVNTIEVSSKVLKYLSELDTYPKVMGICKKMENKNIGSRILMLDGIQDPGNLGTIIRSCVAFNIDTIILGKNCVDLYNSKVLRSTQGMIFNINIVSKELEDVILDLKNKNYKIYGTNVNGGKNLKMIEKPLKFAIIMGNEGNGVSNNILNLCDEYIYINMNNKCESLNVGVATSIILYEFDK